MSPVFDTALLDKIREHPVIAVLVIDDAEHALPVAEALLAGGVRIMELTMRTDAALPALQRICRDLPEMVAGTGTVLTPDMVKQVAEAGAAFAVAPGFNPRVVKAAMAEGLSFAPGIVTASDIEGAAELGCRLLKFFPAEPSGGLPYLKSMAAPYTHLGIRYVPLGGLNAKNAGDYLTSPLVAGIGGSWLAKRDAIAAKDWKQIEANARGAVELVEAVRKRNAAS